MRVYGEADLRRAARRDGLRRLLLWKPINAVVVAAVSRLPAFDRRARIPVRRAFAEYRLASGDVVRMLDPHRCSVARNLFWAKGRLPSAAARTIPPPMRSMCSSRKRWQRAVLPFTTIA